MEQNIGYLLADSARLLRRIFDERVRGLGLTSVQARLLLVLVKFPDNNQAFYADRLEVEPITLTRIVDRMEEAGLVKRAQDPRDRRARLLLLTDKSRTLLEPLRTDVDRLIEDMLLGLRPADRDALARILTAVSANLTVKRTQPESAHG